MPMLTPHYDVLLRLNRNCVLLLIRHGSLAPHQRHQAMNVAPRAAVPRKRRSGLISILVLMSAIMWEKAAGDLTFYPRRIMEGGSNIIRLTTDVTGLGANDVAEGEWTRPTSSGAVLPFLSWVSPSLHDRGEPRKWRSIRLDLK